MTQHPLATFVWAQPSQSPHAQATGHSESWESLLTPAREGVCSEHTHGPGELGEDPELTKRAPHLSQKPSLTACTLIDTTPMMGSQPATHHTAPLQPRSKLREGQLAGSSLPSLKTLGPKVSGDGGLVPMAGPQRMRGEVLVTRAGRGAATGRAPRGLTSPSLRHAGAQAGWGPGAGPCPHTGPSTQGTLASLSLSHSCPRVP